jgi:hypothetical protein
LLASGESVGDGAHEQGFAWWAVLVPRGSALPEVAVGVVDDVTDRAQRGQDVGFAVGLVISQRFAGPLPGDEDPPTDEPEGFPLVRLA